MEQEEDHVVLGEELRHRRQFVGADLALGGVDGVLLLALPELINPPEAVVGNEDVARKPFENRLQLLTLLGRKRDLEHRIARAEDLRKHPLREVAREHEPVDAALAADFAALVE